MFFNLIEERKSIRKYLDKSVEEEILYKILDAARLSPSAGNKQPWLFYVVRDEKIKSKFKKVYNKEWFYTAPVIICGCYDTTKSYKRVYDKADYGIVDVTIAMDHLILAAHEIGLGTCWIAAFKEKPLREILSLPDKIMPVVLTPVGYPDDEGREKIRKELSEIVKYV